MENGFCSVMESDISTRKMESILCMLLKFVIYQSRPLQNVLFCPISASDSNFNPRNTQCIPVVKIFAFLELEQN